MFFIFIFLTLLMMLLGNINDGHSCLTLLHGLTRCWLSRSFRLICLKMSDLRYSSMDLVSSSFSNTPTFIRKSVIIHFSTNTSKAPATLFSEHSSNSLPRHLSFRRVAARARLLFLSYLERFFLLKCWMIWLHSA